jgi:hypothetical protein
MEIVWRNTGPIRGHEQPVSDRAISANLAYHERTFTAAVISSSGDGERRK